MQQKLGQERIRDDVKLTRTRMNDELKKTQKTEKPKKSEKK